MHSNRIQSSAYGHLYGCNTTCKQCFYRQPPFKVLPRGILQHTTAPAIQSHQLHTNHYHLLLGTRHQMLSTPPSKSPLLTFKGTVVSWGEKEPEVSKMLQWTSMWLSIWHIFTMLPEKMHSWLIVRASEQSDRDPKRADRWGWQQTRQTLCFSTKLSICWSLMIIVTHASSVLASRPKWPFVLHLVGKIAFRKIMESVLLVIFADSVCARVRMRV